MCFEFFVAVFPMVKEKEGKEKRVKMLSLLMSIKYGIYNEQEIENQSSATIEQIERNEGITLNLDLNLSLGLPFF
jgi:hypothetical protein